MSISIKFNHLSRCILSGLVALAVLLPLLLQPAVALAQGATSDYISLGRIQGGYRSTFSFAILTDSHLGYGPANAATQRAFDDMVLRHKDISFAIHMGDLTETGSQDQYALFKNLASELTFKVMPTLGNHEARWQDPQGSILKSQFGSPNFSFDFGSWHFVVLNTTYPGETLGTLDPSALAWMESDLSANKGKPVAVFSHHPLMYPYKEFQDADDEFAKILDKYQVAAVFSGHGHEFITWRSQGRQFQMIGALMDGAYSYVQVDGTWMTVYSVKPSANGTMQESVIEKVNGSLTSADKNPVSSFTVSLDDNYVLTGHFNLTRTAQMAFEIDGGNYNDLGNMGQGAHSFAVNVAGQAKGTHSIRVKALCSGIPFYTSAEFGKDSADLVAWSKDLGSAATGEMLQLGQDKAILGTRAGDLICVSLRDGKTVWQQRTGSAWGGGVLDGNRLYVSTQAGEVMSMNAEDGSVSWRAAVDKSGFFSAPSVAATPKGKLVIVGSSSGKLQALNAVTGTKVWQFEAKGAIASSPTVADGKVFFGAWDCNVYALDAATGASLWTATLGRQIYYSPHFTPCVYAGKVFSTTAYDGTLGGSMLFALDEGTGRVVWAAKGGSSFGAPRKDEQGRILVPDASGDIKVYSQSDGTLLSEVSGGDTLFTSLPSSDSIYVTGGYRGILRFIGPDGPSDYFVRYSHLFVNPLLVKMSYAGTSSSAGQRARYLTLTADTKGRVTALAFPR